MIQDVMGGEKNFHNNLKTKIHKFVLGTYDATEFFPKSELYGSVSQLRRAALSIMLNYVEGFARKRPKVKLNFFEISFGSAKECRYLIYLAKEKSWMTVEQYNNLYQHLDEIGAMV